MVAISILTIGFLGIASLLTRSFFLNRVDADEATATYLAAEGIELAKNIIDYDMYQGTWGACLSLTAGVHKDYEFDYRTLTSSPINCGSLSSAVFDSSDPDHLEFDPVTHRYGYDLPSTDAPVTTSFVRDVAVSMPGASNGEEIVVNSTVTWSTGPITAQSVTLEDHFYNWLP